MEKKTLYTETVKTGNRTFYFDIKQTSNENNYLTISSVTRKGEEQERKQIVVFETEMDQFSESFVRTLLQLGKGKEAKAYGFKAGKRSIYCNIKQTQKGQNYILISTTRKKDGEEDEREALFIFENEIKDFAAMMARTLINFTRTTTSRTQVIEKAKQAHANAYEPWTKKDEADLALLYTEGKSNDELSAHFQRHPKAITARIEKLGLVESKVAA